MCYIITGSSFFVLMDLFCIKRYGRAMSQKLYLIDYERSLENSKNAYWRFTMMGNSDQRYTLFFSPLKISCDCPDFKNFYGTSLCKHLFYVFGFVAKFSFDEIRKNDFPLMREKLFHMFDCLFDNKNFVDVDGSDDCAICMQSLESNCHQCGKCHQILHIECLRIWLKCNASCPFCRYQTFISPATSLKPFVQKKPVFLEED